MTRERRKGRSTGGRAAGVIVLFLVLLVGGFIAWDRHDYDIPEWVELRGDPWTSTNPATGKPNRTFTAVACRAIYNVSQELAVWKIERRGR